jgi:hypothetical protein
MIIVSHWYSDQMKCSDFKAFKADVESVMLHDCGWVILTVRLAIADDGKEACGSGARWISGSDGFHAEQFREDKDRELGGLLVATDFTQRDLEKRKKEKEREGREGREERGYKYSKESSHAEDDANPPSYPPSLRPRFVVYFTFARQQG